MRSDHRTITRARAAVAERHETGLPTLLLAALAAVLATVVAIWAVAASSAAWAMVLAFAVAMGGLVGVITSQQRSSRARVSIGRRSDEEG